MITAELAAVSTSFIGRNRELGEIVRLLARDSRLLTLVGPGGMGKTRLALEAARRLSTRQNGTDRQDAPTFANDVYFIPLQSLASPDFLVPAIANAVGLQCSEGGEIRRQLLDYCRPKSMLLMLDNLEHLLESVHLLSEILAAAPGVRILATSRERLNLVEEWVLDLGGLDYPASEPDPDIERYTAVELFVQHARRVNAGFTLNEANRSAVARICRLVEGMPLAIELAAAWVRALSCEAIGNEIARSLDILETSARNIELRHRTMRAAFEPTWERLSDEMQTVFRKLSVFRGGFRRQAAETIAGASLRILSSLIDKSLLRADETGRYDLHELLRQYGEEQLLASGETQAILDAHSAYFMDFVHQREADLKGRRQLEALDEIEADLDNVRVAWLWAVKQQYAQTITRAAESLRLFSDMRSRFQEGDELFRQAEETFAVADERVWARVAARRIWSQVLGDLVFDEDAALARLDRCLAIARGNDDRGETAFCLWLKGILSFYFTDVSMSLFNESLDIYRELGDPFFVGDLLSWIGVAEPDYEVAHDLFEQALNIHRRNGAVNLVAWSLINIGISHFYMNNLAEAESAFQETLSLQRARGDRKGQSWSLYWLGKIAFAAGDFERAHALADENQTFSRNLNILYGNKGSLGLLGVLAAIMDEDYHRARQLVEQVLAMPRPTPDGQSTFDALFGSAVAACGLGDFETARQYLDQLIELGNEIDDTTILLAGLPIAAIILVNEGEKVRAVELLGLAFSRIHITTWMERWPLLKRLRAQLEAELGAHAYSTAWERGGQLDLLSTIGELSSRNGQHDAASTANGLTSREIEILRLTAEGLSNREIAERLVFSIGTVKWYLNQIYSKLHVGSRTQAVARGRELRLLN